MIFDLGFLYIKTIRYSNKMCDSKYQQQILAKSFVFPPLL